MMNLGGTAAYSAAEVENDCRPSALAAGTWGRVLLPVPAPSGCTGLQSGYFWKIWLCSQAQLHVFVLTVDNVYRAPRSSATPRLLWINCTRCPGLFSSSAPPPPPISAASTVYL